MLKSRLKIFVLLPLFTIGFTFIPSDTEKMKRTIDKTTEKSVKVKLDLGTGNLFLAKNTSKRILEAQFEYNPVGINPKIKYSKDNSQGVLKINTKGSGKDKDIDVDIDDEDMVDVDVDIDIDDSDDKYEKGYKHPKPPKPPKPPKISHYGSDDNVWDLRFTDELPLYFNIELGACESEIDFTGLRVKDLKLEIGASKGTISFNEPNRERIEKLKIEAGASKFKATGLLNANFEELQFEGGVGTFVLDFSGELDHRAYIDIEMGIGTLTILIPKKVGVKIISDNSFFTSLSMEGFRKIGKNRFVSEKFGKQNEELEINIESGVGTVNIEWVE
jgi:hypothetical protein